MKKFLIATVAVFFAWEILDFVIHSVLLAQMYKETASLWRPMAEMKVGVMVFVTLISAASFCYLYYAFVSEKTMANALKFGLVFGIGGGVSMGYGSYAVMPMPYMMAFAWFLGTVIELVVAGLILGLILKPEAAV